MSLSNITRKVQFFIILKRKQPKHLWPTFIERHYTCLCAYDRGHTSTLPCYFLLPKDINTEIQDMCLLEKSKPPKNTLEIPLNANTINII